MTGRHVAKPAVWSFIFPEGRRVWWVKRNRPDPAVRSDGGVVVHGSFVLALDDALGTEGRGFVPVGWRRIVCWQHGPEWRFVWRCTRCGVRWADAPARHECPFD